MPPKIKAPPKLCVECNQKGRLVKKLNIIICIECNKLDTYTLITKTKAKLNYFLTDDDLDDEHLVSYEGKSGYGIGTFYTIYDIKKKVCQKYNASRGIVNTDTNLDISQCDTIIKQIINSKKETKEERRLKRNEKKQIQCNKRKAELETALHKAGLQLRSDSTLCSNYIDGKIDGKIDGNTSHGRSHDSNMYTTIDQIVKRMCNMKYLYDYCHMEECRDIAYEEYRETLKAGYYPDCSVSDSAEYLALKKYSNSTYPLIYPWQVQDA
jgi:hypothetical protein